MEDGADQRIAVEDVQRGADHMRCWVVQGALSCGVHGRAFESLFCPTALQIINGTTFSTANLVPGIANQLAAARSGNGETPSLGTCTRTFDAKLNPWLLTESVGREF